MVSTADPNAALVHIELVFSSLDAVMQHNNGDNENGGLVPPAGSAILV